MGLTTFRKRRAEAQKVENPKNKIKKSSKKDKK